MPSAKEKFAASGVREAHHKWASSETGEKATDYAMLALFDDIATRGDSADANVLLAGAMRFKKILLDLGNPEAERKIKPLATDNLKAPH